jgi:pSer/pThr/pTyr-binding forkhead associated (FHA) protein
MFFVEDLGSTNGTLVNDQLTTGSTPLNDGDIVGLGETIRLAFFGISPPRPATSQTADRTTAEMMAFEEPEAEAAVLDDPYATNDFGYTPKSESNRRRWILGCGCGLLLACFLCAATLFFLDSFEEGRLLYCGPLQPLFETILGPFGFSPACATA